MAIRAIAAHYEAGRTGGYAMVAQEPDTNRYAGALE